MTSPLLPVIDHVTLVVSDLAVSASFYTDVLAPLGIHRLDDDADGSIAFGRPGADDFAIVAAEDVPTTTTAHVAFAAATDDAVDAFYAAAKATGAQTRRLPGVQLQYSANYYAVFVSDPDGNNIEAVHHWTTS